MSLRSFAADDIFISYTRRDTSTYAAGLAEELTKRGFSCFIDKLGTDPDADLPDMLKRKIRSCAMLVVVCTEWSGTRQTIEAEIGEFLRTGRRTSIVPVDFGDAVYGARWYNLIEGIAPESEKNPDALDDGNPSPSVVSRIEKQFNYTRRNVRLRRVTYATAAVLALLVLASVVAAGYAGQQLKAAEAARREAQDAQAEAERQQRLGESRSIASRSQTILSRNPDKLRLSVSLAIDALKRSRTVEADSALRGSVELLPRLRRRVVYQDDGDATALSPDGRHYASVSGKTLRIYEAGSETPLKEIPCDCGEVALSNGPAFAAVRVGEGYRILDLNGGGTRTVKPRDGVRYSDLAMSPGGGYLAHTARRPDEYGCGADWVEVIDTRSGEMVKALAEDLRMNVGDVAFEQTGILAAGGAGCVDQQESYGRVVIWTLRYESQGEAAESLAGDAFASQINEYHDLPVSAVAPGPGEGSYATDRGVWRVVRRNLYEPVALFPLIGSKPIVEEMNDIRRSNYDVSLLAFGAGGDRVTLVRRLMESEDGRTVYRPQLEVWDSTGHQETARGYERDVAALVFRPGGRLVAARVNQSQTPLRVFNTDDGAKVKAGGADLVDFEMLSKWTDRTSPDLRFVLAAGDDAVRVLDTLEAKTATIPHAGLFSELSATALAPDGAFLALAGKSKAEGGGNLVIVYRRSVANAYAERDRLRLDEPASAIDLSPDGRHLAVLAKTVRVWELVQKRDVTPAGLRQVEDLASLKFSPEGRFLATIDDIMGVVSPGSVRVWRLADSKELEPLHHVGAVLVCLFSPDDRLLLTAGEDRVTQLPGFCAIKEDSHWG